MLKFKWLIKFKKVPKVFNPILDGGGPLWPGWPWTASLFPQGKSYDHQNSWLCFCLCLNGPMKVIFGFCFQNFWKTEKKFFDDFDIKGSPLWKKNRKYQKKFFFGKNHTFSFWICIVHVLCLFLICINLMYQKILIFTYFCMIIFIFYHGLSTASLAKTTAHSVLFLVPINSQR